MSSNDFDGPDSGLAGRGADGQGAADQGAGHDAPGAGGAAYPAPEGWETGGFWRDSAIDADYETMQGAIPPVDRGPRQDPGYSFWADGRGWENSPGASAQPGGGAQAGAGAQPGQPSDPTSFDMTRAYGAGQGRAGGYGGTAGYPGGFGAPGGPMGPGGPGGPGGPAGPGRPGGPRGRGGKPRRKWYRPTWKKALAVTGGLFVLFVAGAFGVYQYLSSSAVIPAALSSANYQNTIVYYADGKTVIGTIGSVNRQDLTYQQLPANLKNAVLAAEDKSFFTEGGISPSGILRSAYDDVMHSGGSLSGGSTITQEFVRGYYDGVGAQQTVSRKIKEIFIAQKLAGMKSKEWILTNYLNLIYLGSNSYGVAAAAQTYFGLPVDKLSVAQDAVIASIIQQPSNFPLPQYRADLKARWSAVLGDMVKDNFITQAQADSATFPKLLTDTQSSTPVEQVGATANNSDPWAPYILAVVTNELTGVDHVTQQQLETGGLRVVTTISRPMEVEMYKAVNSNIAAIKATPGAQYPSYMRVGAELQNPKNGEILATYPGPGWHVKNCNAWNCQLDMAIYAREQVGSSFKPYVLSAAVADGMNVKTSVLNAAPQVCVPTDNLAMTLSKDMKYFSTSMCAQNGMPGWFAVQNDASETIPGTSPKTLYGSTVQNALAQSSNTAYSDLAHRVTTSKVIEMANSYGVNIASFKQGGSGLSDLVGQAGLALGTASLTVNEQTTMLSTIADNGVYHTAHIVKYWQLPDGPQQKPIMQTRGVLDPANAANNAGLDSQVQYAMSMTTVDGTGTGAAVGLGNRPIIAKTGTTTGSHSGFFIGAIPQYSLVVAMFTESQSNTSPESLAVLTGGGFGGYWPARIWNTFAQAEFASLPVQDFQNPVFTGAKWNQIGKLPKPKPTSCTVTINGHKFKIPLTGKNKNKKCSQVTPNPNPTPTPPGHRRHHGGGPTGFPTASSTPGFPTQSSSPPATPSSTGSSTATATATPSATGPGGGNGPGGAGGLGTATAAGAKAGLAVGGVLMVLPGSLLWTTMSRRRRRRGKGTAE